MPVRKYSSKIVSKLCLEIAWQPVQIQERFTNYALFIPLRSRCATKQRDANLAMQEKVSSTHTNVLQHPISKSHRSFSA